MPLFTRTTRTSGGRLKTVRSCGGKRAESNVIGTPGDSYMKLQHKKSKIIVAMATLRPFIEAARRAP
jgi:hypothetical protein